MTLRRIAVLGLARSGRAAAQLALANGISVYAADAAVNEELQRSADELGSQGAEVELGTISIDKLLAADALVVSPGIPPRTPPFDDPRLARVQRLSEIEFAFRFLDSHIVAITGTNGKSTTTALAGHLLKTGGLHAVVAGNIGHALSNVALLDQQPDWVVVEVSSFQLADTDKFAPNIGVVTNLAPDHLDRYDSVGAYYADKARLFNRSSVDTIWILNGEDADVMALPGEAEGRRLIFKTATALEEGEHGAFISADGELVLKVDSLHAKLIHTSELQLMGRHNQANALAAALIAIGTSVPLSSIREGLRTFAGLPHRLQVVSKAGGVTWINDSKATNIASTVVALQSVSSPTVLLLGGRHKGEPYTALLPHMHHVTRVLAFGEAAPLIVQDLKGKAEVEQVSGSLDQVVERAAAVAVSGDAVLLSPACSSFDMFRNYEERGAAFARALQQVPNG